MTQTRPYALALGGLLAMAAAMGIGRFVYTPILPEMIADLGLSKSSAGFIASANFTGYLVGALAAARPTFANQPRTWLLAALTASAVTTMAMGWGEALSWQAALRFIGGATSAFVIVCASTLVLRRLTQADGPLPTAVHFAGVGVGIALSSIIVAALTAAEASWRLSWLGTGTLALLAVPLVARLVGSAEPAHPADPIAPEKPQDPRPLRLVIAAYGLFGLGYVITATFIVTIVREDPGLAAIEPWIWLLVGLTAVPSVALWSWLASKIGLLQALAAACALEAIGVALSVELPSTLGLALSATLLGGTFMGITALGLTAARTLSTGTPQRAIAFATASFALGQAVGPVLAGVMVDWLGGFRVPSLMAAGALMIAAVLAVAASKKSR